MNKRAKQLTKEIPGYGKIKRKNRYKGSNNQIKDKAWTVLSDYTRMRDFIKFGHCISSGKKIIDWRSTDAGHFESMGGNGAAVGFSDLNVHAQAKDDNAWGGMAAGARYKEELLRRYGNEILVDIKKLKNSTVKADDFFFLDKINEHLENFRKLKEERPEYDYPEYI